MVILGPLDGKSTQRWQLLCEPSPAPWAGDGQRARFGDCPCALVSPLRPESCSLSPVLDIGWQPKCWHGLREVPWAGGDFGTALMALAPPQLLPGLISGCEAALPPHSGCVHLSRHKLWGFLGQQEEDEPWQPPEALFVLCGSSNGLEMAGNLLSHTAAC